MSAYIVDKGNEQKKSTVEHLQDVQNQYESAFNNINNKLNSLLNQTSDFKNLDSKRSLQTLDISSILNFPKFKFDGGNFSQKLCQEVQEIIQTKVKKQIKIKQESLKQVQKKQVQEQVQEVKHNLEQNFEYCKKEFKQQIEQKLQDKETQQQLKSQQNIQQSQIIYQPIHQSSQKPFTYQHMEQYSVQQNERCLAIAINKDCSNLLAGCNSQIKVFEFKQGILKQFKYQVTIKQSQFISASDDNSIIIWKNNFNNKWIQQQRLEGHGSGISCLIVNNNENIIISGSQDNTIQFWIKKNEWLWNQTITDHTDWIYGLSFNQQQNKVKSCGSDKKILIIQQSLQNKEWSVTQEIIVAQDGYRICFIDNNIFTFQPYNGEQLSIFGMNSTNKKYEQIKAISVQCGSDGNCLFPQQYIIQKCMLMSKSDQYVNLIRKKQNGELVTEQSIYFGTYDLYGVMSDNGEYLITWDKKSNQIQIRKYQEV
ncbi:unnamed protein product [Paramecium sonneborni]|uniref:WD40-repeat-containing domain n=1 Tax=Paramecium sonneborni TaxID=65129 RepID=A0A8S1LPH7_9CILI|nr:unnamed protein product [Paramecium sonneborni]